MTLGRHWLAAAVVAAVCVSPGFDAVASASVPPSQGAHGPRVTAHNAAAKKLLPRPMSGKAALKALDAAGKRAAAAANHTTVAALTAHIDADRTVGLGPTGKIFFADTATADDAARAASSQGAPAWSLYPNSQAFLLHSKPGSNHTIYLDFDGYTLPASNAWSPGIPSGTYGGFTMDGSASFSDDELTYIQTVWRIVAEKYAAFDVDVTTQAPAAGALDYTGGGDLTWGSRAVITSDMSARGSVCTANSGGGCLGIAYIDSFNAPEPSPGYFEPAWVYTKFTAATATLTAGQIANAAAHELGHNLGLDHDATNSNQTYYGGSGNWFPIMGSGVLAVGQFSKGDYPDAWTGSNQKNGNPDDLAVIASAGAPLRADDFGGTTGSATTVTTGSTTLGIISTRTDVDMFKVVTTCQGDLAAAATGIGDGQAVDLKVSILNSGGSLLTSDDPTSSQDSGTPWPFTPTGLDATATQTSATAGTYYVSIDGVGKGTFATGGYDDYGSIGQYQLAVSGCSGGQVAPSAPTSLVTTPGVHTTTGSVSWSPPADPGSSAVSSYTVSGVPGGPFVVNAPTTSKSLSNLAPGTTYTVSVTASSDAGTSPAATKSIKVLTWAPTAAPTLIVTPHTTSVDVDWTAPANPGKATPTGWHVALFDAGHNVVLANSAQPLAATGVTITGLSPGSYSVEVYQDVTSNDGSASATASEGFTLAATIPSAPKIGTPSSGVSGGTSTATARWAGPASTGGSAITGYRVIAYKSTISGRVISAKISKLLGPSARSYKFVLPTGRYKFRVVAYNAVGRSPYSGYSTLVYAR